MSNLIGQSIGRYHITEQLGQGGMATVYKAYDTRLESEVAVKVIRTDMFPPAALERVLKRFEREAKALARLTHPNIVSVLDYGEHDGAPYLIMKYLPGGTLKDRLRQPMPYAEAAHLLAPVARALAYAHGQGILHRDVKPSNILITQSGEPVLTDFGIAKLLEQQDVATLTGTGLGVGTPEYMAPEQGLGKEIDGRADVYALGIVFYELVTGRKPFAAETPMAVLLKQFNDPLPRPKDFIPDLPEGTEQVLFKALAKNPDDRYEDMTSFAKALEKLTQSTEQPERQPDLPAKSISKPIKPADDLLTRDEMPIDDNFNIPQNEVHVETKALPSLKKAAVQLAGLTLLVIVIFGALRLSITRTGQETATQTAAMKSTDQGKVIAMQQTAQFVKTITAQPLSHTSTPTPMLINMVTETPEMEVGSPQVSDLTLSSSKLIYLSSQNMHVFDFTNNGNQELQKSNDSTWKIDDKEIVFKNGAVYWNDLSKGIVCTGKCNNLLGKNLFAGEGITTEFVPEGKAPPSEKCTSTGNSFKSLRGGEILYIFSCPNGMHGIYNGSKLVSNPKFTNPYNPVWSPSGLSFLYLNLGVGDVDIIHNDEILTSDVKGEISDPTWSRDETRIAYVIRDTASILRDYCILDVKLKTSNCFYTNDSDEINPVISPDNTYIAYSRKVDNDYEIFVTDLRSQKEIRITENDVDDIFPLWSPFENN